MLVMSRRRRSPNLPVPATLCRGARSDDHDLSGRASFVSSMLAGALCVRRRLHQHYDLIYGDSDVANPVSTRLGRE